jgi:diguanylate cyclase (GGDEF)-like protein/PAS domain S-box-containing protein
MRAIKALSKISSLLSALDRRLLVIVAGFLGVMVLTAIVVGIALARMGATTQQLDYVVHNLNVKTALIADARENVYRRITSLRDMLLMKDVFDIDAESLRFYGYGKQIEDSLTRLGELVTDPADAQFLEQFSAPAKEGTAAQNDVIGLLISGKNQRQIAPQLQRAFAAQRQVLENLQKLHARFEEGAQKIVRQTLDDYRFTRSLVYILSGLATVIALVIAGLVATMLQRQMRAVESERLKFKTLFEASPDAVLILDRHRIVEWNRRAIDWFDHQGVSDLSGLDIASLSPAQQPDGRASDEAWMDKVRLASSQRGGMFDWLFRARDGSDFYGEISLTPVGTGKEALVQLVVRDVTERRLAELQMLHQATHDPLTGLANRRAFEKFLQQAIDGARVGGSEHVLCFLDLDYFKQVNDQGGHAMGDELLKQLAALIKSRVRDHDLVARLGGDEFALVLENCPLERAGTIVESIHSAVDTLLNASASDR